ncbi:MAG TPA: 5-formyltetrahydrofolate cyclo-ligase [Actinobacteria bacterium]|nr:5-formyltetrahydrofolate cyclo-ligase [Actinomycetota bacterium]
MSDETAKRTVADKSEVRARIRQQRHHRQQRNQRDNSDAAITAEVAERVAWWSMVRGAGVVAAFAATADEPATDALLVAIRDNSIRVLLPVIPEDETSQDLQWSPFIDLDDLVPGPHGIRHPVGPTYGPQALAGVDLMIVPALAVDTDGHRLGRGRGYYDRAIAHLRPDVPVIAWVWDDEVLAPGSFRVEDHDAPVTHVCTPRDGLRAAGGEVGQ